MRSPLLTRTVVGATIAYLSNTPHIHMSIWVTRRNLDGSQAVAPIRCVDVDAVASQPGYRTLPECLAILVLPDESCTGEGTRRPIERSGRVVGYLMLTAESRQETPAPNYSAGKPG